MMHRLGPTDVTPSDYTPLAVLVNNPASVIVRANASWNDVRELRADAQASPGRSGLRHVARLHRGPRAIESRWHVASISDRPRAIALMIATLLVVFADFRMRRRAAAA